jgi:perosamine synthetase
MYHEILAAEDRLIVPTEPAGCVMSWFVYVVRLADKTLTIETRNAILKRMIERGIQVSNYFPPVYLQPFISGELGHKEGDFPITDEVCKSTMALPFHNNLTKQEVEIVCTELKATLDEIL